jgi:hypothetical protein
MARFPAGAVFDVTLHNVTEFKRVTGLVPEIRSAVEGDAGAKSLQHPNKTGVSSSVRSGKGGVGIPVGVLPQQIHAGRVVHPSINGRRREKVPTNIESIPDTTLSTTDEHGFIPTANYTKHANSFQRKDARALAAC